MLYTQEEYLKLPLKEKLFFYEKDGRLFHIIAAQQFSIFHLESLFEIADIIKKISRKSNGAEFLSSLLQHKRAMLYFTQPSTRTFLSFLTACQTVGMNTGEVREASLSSEMKGETQEDGVRTFSSYFDAIIMRDPKPGFCEYIAYLFEKTARNVPIINGGSGKDQHPTQALLDLYTLHRSFQARGGISKKKYGFVGDLLRGRAARSLIYLLSKYPQVELYFVAPPTFQIGYDIEAYLTTSKVNFQKTENLNEVLPEVDALYMTRVQDEYDLSIGESALVNTTDFHLTMKNLPLMKKDAVILHPLPRRQEIAQEVDYDPRAMYWRQLRNGMYIRSALLLYIFRMEHSLQEY